VTASERRQHKRVDLPGSLRGSVDLRTDVQVLNLSPAGGLIDHGGRLCPGQICLLFLQLPGAPVRLRANVVWSQVNGLHGGPNGRRELRLRSGLHFPEPPADEQAHLRQFLATLRGSKPAPRDREDQGPAAAAALAPAISEPRP